MGSTFRRNCDFDPSLHLRINRVSAGVSGAIRSKWPIGARRRTDFKEVRIADYVCPDQRRDGRDYDFEEIATGL